MKKNQTHGDEVDAEILKAVAQAWHGHANTCKAAEERSEFDARRMYFKGKPSRFKVEALSRASKKEQSGKSWDFGQSLWDAYEIVSVSKKLETGLVNEEPRGVMRRRESKNSLRSLFNRVSTTRFTEDSESP